MVDRIPGARRRGGAVLVAVRWSRNSGQYEDLDGAAHRVLDDANDDVPKS